MLARYSRAVKAKLTEKLTDIFQASFIEEVDLSVDTIVWLVTERWEWLNARMIHRNCDMEELEENKYETVEKICSTLPDYSIECFK